MRLSNNFSLWEMTRSQTAARKGIPNSPSSEEIRALESLCLHVLQPIRDHFGPVNVNSGYRGPALNSAIGGSHRSQHMSGEAADIEVFGVSNLDLAKWIEKSKLPYDQLILEFHDPYAGPNSGWVHVSHTAGVNRRQVYTARRGSHGTVYDRGLPSTDD